MYNSTFKFQKVARDKIFESKFLFCLLLEFISECKSAASIKIGSRSVVSKVILKYKLMRHCYGLQCIHTAAHCAFSIDCAYRRGVSCFVAPAKPVNESCGRHTLVQKKIKQCVALKQLMQIAGVARPDSLLGLYASQAWTMNENNRIRCCHLK